MNIEKMKTVPRLYTDIGKKARDLLYKDYQSKHTFTLTTLTSSGVAITSSGSKEKDEFLLAGVGAKFIHENMTTDVKVDTNSDLYTTITVDEPAPGMKAIFNFQVPNMRTGMLELQYLHEQVGISTSVGLEPNPTVNFSGVLRGPVGNIALACGADLSFDTASRNFSKFSYGVSYTIADLVATLNVIDYADRLSLTYYQTVSPLTNTALGAELNHRVPTKESVLNVGAQHALDPLTLVKIRVNNQGKANALLQHEWRPKSLITFSGEVDTRDIERSAKLGVAIVLKP